MIVIYGRGTFPILKRFRLLLLRSTSYLTFQAGAMPMVQNLELIIYSVKEWKPNGDGLAGIEHLPALEEVSACFFCPNAAESEKSSAESAFRSAVDMHAGNPRIKVRFMP